MAAPDELDLVQNIRFRGMIQYPADGQVKLDMDSFGSVRADAIESVYIVNSKRSETDTAECFFVAVGTRSGQHYMLSGNLHEHYDMAEEEETGLKMLLNW